MHTKRDINFIVLFAPNSEINSVLLSCGSDFFLISVGYYINLICVGCYIKLISKYNQILIKNLSSAGSMHIKLQRLC